MLFFPLCLKADKVSDVYQACVSCLAAVTCVDVLPRDVPLPSRCSSQFVFPPNASLWILSRADRRRLFADCKLQQSCGAFVRLGFGKNIKVTFFANGFKSCTAEGLKTKEETSVQQ